MTAWIEKSNEDSVGSSTITLKLEHAKYIINCAYERICRCSVRIGVEDI